MKRLFMLSDLYGHPFIGIPRANGPLSFPNKKEAKERRDELNTGKVDGYPFKVSPGPDHHNYKG